MIDSTLYVVAQICKTAEMTGELRRRIEKGFYPVIQLKKEARGEEKKKKLGRERRRSCCIGKRQKAAYYRSRSYRHRERERVRRLVLFLFSIYSDARFQEQKKNSILNLEGSLATDP